ncbi:hypothetical protein SAMN02910413_1187 [Pseudobutyrivibrio sp. C4]|uniref:PcfJ domain-containing protein n=1 Tax=Pseudobutyrivibrio sp. C4 TaxID=1520803 RepID=UPI0008B2A706|nr:PcfJ domain-containing protein [Pseudobutyrivibrio sp. C4]SES90405.1 hypothetical protein SAMN02910413_1187 [Pseudobutyrivibrio sp. C4]
MLDFSFTNNTWEPERLEIDEYYKLIEVKHTTLNKMKIYDVPYFVVVKYEPDIVGYWFIFERDGCMAHKKRYVFHEGYSWDWKLENIFDEFVRDKSSIFICPFLDEIHAKYSQLHDEWHLQRYYKHPVKMLDHIYHCMKRNSVKELLYKAGMDELAVYRGEIEDLNLLATSPSKVFGGINNRILRVLNNEYGAELLSGEPNRRFIKSFIQNNSWIMDSGLNNFQCEYLLRLRQKKNYHQNYKLYIDTLRKLNNAWTRGQYQMRIEYENKLIEKRANYERFGNIDPIFVPYLEEVESNIETLTYRYDSLNYYLFSENENINNRLGKSNLNRTPELEEQYECFIFKYPNSAEEFCKAAAYMKNCLTGYIYPHIYHECDIVFVYRNSDRYPYIAFRIEDDTVVEARYRFNRDLNESDSEMLKLYCQRHNLKEIDEALPFR